MARALAELSARHHATELFVPAILDALDATNREAALDSVRKFVGSMDEAMPPSFVPAGNEWLTEMNSGEFCKS